MNPKDLGSGAFFMAVGLLYGGVALGTLPMGSALKMGPGYFPIVLSGTLFCLGLLITVRGVIDRVGTTPFGQTPWRGVVVISLSILVFAFSLERLGLFLTVAFTAGVAALAKPGVGAKRASLVGLSIAAFCTAVFSYGIRLNVPVLGSWLVR